MKSVKIKKGSFKFPSNQQWKKFFICLSKKEKIAFLVFSFLALFSFIFLTSNFYIRHTEVFPKSGGSYKEGLIGQPRFINPIYLSSQDIDRDIVEILFSGLMKYDTQGNLKNDLAKSYEVINQGKTFEFTLKENILWHDGTPLTTDDIIFTVSIIQNPEYGSPLRIKWTGVLTEKVSDTKIIFKLPKAYPGFLETLTLKIIPKHIFENIDPSNLPWTFASKDYLIGSGPFKCKEIKQDSSFVKELVLEKNKEYYEEPAFLNTISFVFFQNENDLLLSDIDGFSLQNQAIKRFTQKEYELEIPRYFALFFNEQRENIVKEKKIREGLAIAIDKNKIIKDVFSNKAQLSSSPILPEFFGFSTSSLEYSFDPILSDEILKNQGYEYNEETKTREKTKTLEADFTFTKNLTLKNTGQEVTELQKCLAKDTEIYPEGIVSGYYGAQTKKAVIKFQEKYATDILTPIGLTKGTGDVKPMTRDKLNEICFEKETESEQMEIILTTRDSFPLAEMAKEIQKDWEKLGIKVVIEKVSLAELETDVLSQRNFDILLLGEALGSIPDPFPFWHSTQKDYPGLNISGYSSQASDNLLETAREEEPQRQASLEEFQDILLKDIPAIFLTRPNFIYSISSDIKGFGMEKITEPAKRFSDITKWHIKTTRKWQ